MNVYITLSHPLSSPSFHIFNFLNVFLVLRFLVHHLLIISEFTLISFSLVDRRRSSRGRCRTAPPLCPMRPQWRRSRIRWRSTKTWRTCWSALMLDWDGQELSAVRLCPLFLLPVVVVLVSGSDPRQFWFCVQVWEEWVRLRCLWPKMMVPAPRMMPRTTSWTASSCQLPRIPRTERQAPKPGKGPDWTGSQVSASHGVTWRLTSESPAELCVQNSVITEKPDPRLISLWSSTVPERQGQWHFQWGHHTETNRQRLWDRGSEIYTYGLIGLDDHVFWTINRSRV